MTLLDQQPPPPPNPWPKRLGLAAAVVVVVGGLLYWQFRFYGEVQQVRHFMDALAAGDYPQAYKIWNPTPTYTYQNFLEDWGETTSMGRVRSYEIAGVESRRNSSGVIVSVRINGREPPVRLWVEKKDKSLGFPPY